MDFDIAGLIAQDGIASGATYAVMALGMVLIFNVTRIIFVPFGDLAAFAALTLSYLQLQQRPGTIWFVVALSITAWILEVIDWAKGHASTGFGQIALRWLVIPMSPAALSYGLATLAVPAWSRLLLCVLLVAPIGPLLYRVVYKPVAKASVLILLTISVSLHFALSGIALICFGPEGLRTTPLVNDDLQFWGVVISSQMLLVAAAAIALSAALYGFFGRTITGKALRATAMNQDGARLVGIRTSSSGTVAFLLASLISAVAGIIISPVTTIYYDSGFMVGLKGFVGATVGGFVAYPAAMIGAVLVGLIESVSSFYMSPLKEFIVFTAIIPIVIWRRFATRSSSPSDDAGEE